MPFTLSIPANQELHPVEVQCERYRVRILQPRVASISYSEAMQNLTLTVHQVSQRVLTVDPQPVSNEILINEIPTFQANLFQMEFHAPDFDRSRSTEVKPPAS